MERDELLASILNSDVNSEYPSEFKAQYDIMECLSEQQGITTFLVMDHNGNSAVAKCYDRSLWTLTDNSAILSSLDHKGLPKQIASFENENVLITVREYADRIPLSRYAQENELTQTEIIRICTGLCDILAYLHHRKEPIIHRDIKPQNIIIGSDGSVSLIDFDIARVYRAGHETDTVFFGTLAYAPPEQYGFSQTDALTDIYSLGIVLRWLLTGSTKKNHPPFDCSMLVHNRKTDANLLYDLKGMSYPDDREKLLRIIFEKDGKCVETAVRMLAYEQEVQRNLAVNGKRNARFAAIEALRLPADRDIIDAVLSDPEADLVLKQYAARLLPKEDPMLDQLCCPFCGGFGSVFHHGGYDDTADMYYSAYEYRVCGHAVRKHSVSGIAEAEDFSISLRDLCGRLKKEQHS